jgi:hypothetical protein
MVLLLILSIVFFILAIRERLTDIVLATSSGECQTDTNTATPSIGAKIGRISKNCQNYWSRVPTDLEMFHRHVAFKSIVKEGGAEMLDAALARKSSS